MPYKILEIDALNIADHSHLLLGEDICYYLMEFTSYQGPFYNAANSYIHNFKKGLEKKDQPGYWHKERAIREIGDIFRNQLNPKALEQWTLVPMPPSRCGSDPLYDDRIIQLINRICLVTTSADVRELIYIKNNMPQSHGSGKRLTPEQIFEYFFIDAELIVPAPKRILIIDDVITAGAHFKAAKRLLLEAFETLEEVRGVFIARRIFVNGHDDE